MSGQLTEIISSDIFSPQKKSLLSHKRSRAPAGELHPYVNVFGGGRHKKHLGETQVIMGRTCKLHTESLCTSRQSNLWYSCCEATVLSTEPPCPPISTHWQEKLN